MDEQKPVAWLIEYAPGLRMVTFATVLKAQADRIKAEHKNLVTVTPLVAGLEASRKGENLTSAQTDPPM